jgi:hypothetical protein
MDNIIRAKILEGKTDDQIVRSLFGNKIANNYKQNQSNMYSDTESWFMRTIANSPDPFRDDPMNPALTGAKMILSAYVAPKEVIPLVHEYLRSMREQPHPVEPSLALSMLLALV